jgi:retron-type reverse transcriptase
MGLADWLAGLFGLRPRPTTRRTFPTTPLAPPPRPTSVPVAGRPVPAAPAVRTPTAVPPTVQRFALTHFAPISQSELAERARKHSLFNDPWLGRVDTIPPADDPRTHLIDRALVSHGYLTPEQLATIHEIGDLYREHRPDLSVVHAQARQLVAVDVEAKAKLKAEKKAAAKARREARRAAVAQRKASDIIFLGRGVSSRLHDRRADIERLRAAGLPALAAPGDVAAFLGLTIPRLRWLAFHSESTTVSHYVFFTVPKKSGGVRRLSAPHRDLAVAQRKIFHEILRKIPVHDAAHGFVTARSIVTNARPHVGAQIIINLDLKDFFPSITFPRIRGILTATGFSPCAATILALLCSESPRQVLGLGGQQLFVATGPRALPQGACTSPVLANLAARFLDARLVGLAKRFGWTYTRYADDLTFSAMDPAVDIGRMLTAIRNVVDDEGFTVNEEKTTVLRRSHAQEVTGLVVNQRPKAPRKLIRRIRAILHRARHDGLAAQNRENLPHFTDWLQGMIAYIAMTDKTTAARFQQQFNACPDQAP